MSELTIKQMINVALEKDINPPDEATGLVLYESSGSLNTEEFTEKGAKGATDPTDDELEVINSFALTPQEKSNWIILRNIDPVGDPLLVDSHSDVFAQAAMKDMALQAVGTPILYDHSHSLDGIPPLGQVIGAKVSKGRLKETWALPKEDYNSSMVKGIMNGTVNKISVGAFIDPKDKVCNSCTDNRSIYSMDCPHIPGRVDPKTGEATTVTIRRVKRYAERSLVNIPARMGTGLKSLTPDQESVFDKLKVAATSPESYPIDGMDALGESIKSLLEATKNSGEEFHKAMKGALELAFPPEELEMPPVLAQTSKKLGETDPPLIYDLPSDYDQVYLQILVPEGKDLTGANPSGTQNFVTDKPLRAFKFNEVLQTQRGDSIVPQIKIDHTLFPDNESVNEGNFVLSIYCSRKELEPPATISDVISEDLVVSKENDKAPEAQEPSEKEEAVTPEAPAAEDKTEAPVPQEEIKSVEVPVVKSLEVEELTKSFTESLKTDLESVNKTLADTNEAIKSFKELQDGQGAQLKTLVDAVASLAEQIVKLSEFSTEEAVTKLLEVAGQIKEQTAPAPKLEPKNVQDVIDMLRK